MNKTFVMIQGSWHGGWRGRGLYDNFQREGIGRTPRRFLVTGRGRCVWGSHQDCIRSVVSYVREQRLEDLILVGHSFGGSVIQRVAEEIPNLIERTVFLDALIVKDGHCVIRRIAGGVRGSV